MIIEMFEKEYEEGESRYEIRVGLAKDYLVRQSNEYYTGLSPALYVGKYIAIEPLRENRHNIGDASMQAARDRLLRDGFHRIAVEPFFLDFSVFKTDEQSTA